MNGEAIIIAANPEMHDYLGDVEMHKKWSEINDKVFWDLIPPGRREIAWKHLEIKRGYFYISRSGKVQYKFLIEKARTVSEFKKSKEWNNLKKFIPDFRTKQWSDSGYDYFFALLIKNITKIDPIPLGEFELLNPRKQVERVMNYVIVADNQTKEVAV